MPIDLPQFLSKPLALPGHRPSRATRGELAYIKRMTENYLPPSNKICLPHGAPARSRSSKQTEAQWFLIDGDSRPVGTAYNEDFTVTCYRVLEVYHGRTHAYDDKEDLWLFNSECLPDTCWWDQQNELLCIKIERDGKKLRQFSKGDGCGELWAVDGHSLKEGVVTFADRGTVRFPKVWENFKAKKLFVKPVKFFLGGESDEGGDDEGGDEDIRDQDEAQLVYIQSGARITEISKQSKHGYQSSIDGIFCYSGDENACSNAISLSLETPADDRLRKTSTLSHIQYAEDGVCTRPKNGVGERWYSNWRDGTGTLFHMDDTPPISLSLALTFRELHTQFLDPL